VVIGCGGEAIARHSRSYEREEVVFDPLHYLPLTEGMGGLVVQRKPVCRDFMMWRRDMSTGETGGRQDQAVRLQELLYSMEPQLRLLQGAVVILHALSETTDSVEPVALAALAHLTGEPVEQITACWHEVLDVARGR